MLGCAARYKARDLRPRRGDKRKVIQVMVAYKAVAPGNAYFRNIKLVTFHVILMPPSLRFITFFFKKTCAPLNALFPTMNKIIRFSKKM